MISWLMGTVVCIALLSGCRGGEGNLVKVEPVREE